VQLEVFGRWVIFSLSAKLLLDLKDGWCIRLV
jgi:hypothetical protein